MPTPTESLTDQQIEQYHRDGFLMLECVADEDELRWVREIYDRLFEEKAGFEEGAQFDLAGTDEGKAGLPQVLGPSRFAPELKEAPSTRRIRRIAEQLHGPLDDSCGEHMIYKPAGYGAATPWHQDQAYHNPHYDYEKANFWMPLDDATPENGCLRFVPGSHKWEVKPHHHINNDPRIHGLEVDDPDQYDAMAVDCPVPAGGVSIHAAYLMHAAGPNHSDRPRRAWIRAYQAPPVRRETPIDDYWNREETPTVRAQRARAAGKDAG